jgi:regulator of protease activity HflC (stomatin/prohibitin superfamily)
MKTVQVALNERVVLLQRGLPKVALGPGRHRCWATQLSELRYCTDTLIFNAAPEVRTMLPETWFKEVQLAAHERALLYRDKLPVQYLRSGVHRYWATDASIELRRFDLREAVPALTSEELALIPKSELLEVNIAATERGLLLRNGRYQQTLTAGLYRYWQYADVRTTVQLVDMRRRNLTLNAQELMTRDKVTLRVTVSTEYVVSDERRMSEQLADVEGAVYQAAQLALRDYVSAVSLDALLEARTDLAQHLNQSVAPRLANVGLELLSIGVKDVVLPGEMKALLNRVIEAEKEAAANVILRREEVAATRSLANTARVMAEQPILLRLKELDALRDIAQHIQEVRVVVGAEGLGSLLPSQLLGGTSSDAKRP